MKVFTMQGREFYSRGRIWRICGLVNAWYEDVEDPPRLVRSLKQNRPSAEIFTFFQRVPHVIPAYNFPMDRYQVSVIELSNYEQWWNSGIGKKTRQAIKKSRKTGVEVRQAVFDDDLVRGIGEICNETPVRQGKRFPHYGDDLPTVRRKHETFIERSEFLGAYYQGKLIGFIKLVFEKEFTDILQLLTRIAYQENNPANALLDQAVRLCCERQVKYLAYGDWNATGLGDFKRHNGFTCMDLPRYYLPVNAWGAIAIKLNLHLGLKSILPPPLVGAFKTMRLYYTKMALGPKRESNPAE
jgi:hypothetical protein